MTKFCGIDPGLDGGIAVYVPELDHMVVMPMPTISIKRGKKARREINTYDLATILAATKPNHLFLELVGAMPGQGVSSTYSFGRGVGQIEGVVAALRIPVTYVAPAVWLKAMKVRGGKDGSRFRAAQLFPEISTLFGKSKNDGLAEAALIAKWGSDNHQPDKAK